MTGTIGFVTHGFRGLAMLAAGALALSACSSPYDENYGRDRAEIEDLQARYLFAMNWGDFETYAGTFTEDGVLDWARGTVTGRDEIRREAEVLWEVFSGQDSETERGENGPKRRHFIANKVIDIDGDAATGRAYWFEFDIEMPGLVPHVLAYGHYEDELRKVGGRWFFSKRAIYNEILEGRQAAAGNPAW